MHVLCLALACAAIGGVGPVDTWKQPLDVKETALERDAVERHNILGLYPSQVVVPLDGGPVDQSTLGASNVVHSVNWTSYYLIGASFRYAYLKRTGAPAAEVAAAKRRADELFEAVYRCQLVTGEPGLQARGYLLGHGETYVERWGETYKDIWRQGKGEYADLRYITTPSHHNYSGATAGLCAYYDLAAEGKERERCREAVHRLVSWWVDHDLMIYDHDHTRPEPILGVTDGKTLNMRALMAIAGAKEAFHVTGDEKFERAYERLVEQYHLRGLKRYTTEKDFDDAQHVLNHLENLCRIEKDPELLAAYRVVAEALWTNHKDDAQSSFTYILAHILPDAPNRDRALHQALFTLQTYPTDTTLRPTMSSLRKDLAPPYPVYAAAWDNEYLWKGNLLRPDGWMARPVIALDVPAEDPMVIYAVDQSGEIYQSRDGAATPAGWHLISAGLPTPARAIAAGARERFLFAVCDDGFYMTTTGGYRWSRMAVPADGGTPVSVQVDPTCPFVLYAVTTRGAYRSADFGEENLGRKWECLTESLPPADRLAFAIGTGGHGRIYAFVNHDVYTRTLDDPAWHRGEPIDLQRDVRLGKRWFCVDTANPDHAITGMVVHLEDMGSYTIVQETRDGGITWTHSQKDTMARYVHGDLLSLLREVPREAIDGPAVLDPCNSSVLYAVAGGPLLRSGDQGKTWSASTKGMSIPVANGVFAPRWSPWVFASTPGGLVVSKDGGTTWSDANLWLQFEHNTRREIGGAAYIDAYWRGRYYGFLDDATVRAAWKTPENAPGR